MQPKSIETCRESIETCRVEILNELLERYGKGGFSSLKNQFLFIRKKYAWLFIVGGANLLKRILDIIFSIVLSVLLIPLFIVVAIGIKITDGGPILFWQQRVGKWWREFPFPKFRSMTVDAEKHKKVLLSQSHHGDSITFKMKDDPRITKIGKIIRRLSIDELPQLICILKGDMSLVGPRPATVDEVNKYTLKDRRRLDAIPGLTCIWQVSGRGDIPFKQQVELDVQYIQSQSFFNDIIILFKTIPAVLTGKGAY